MIRLRFNGYASIHTYMISEFHIFHFFPFQKRKRHRNNSSAVSSETHLKTEMRHSLPNATCGALMPWLMRANDRRM